jgi:hypothetical protein
MPTCSRCGAETELFFSQTPICEDCDNRMAEQIAATRKHDDDREQDSDSGANVQAAVTNARTQRRVSVLRFSTGTADTVHSSCTLIL